MWSKDLSHRPTELLETVVWLHDMGMNVLPLPIGSKEPKIGSKALWFERWGLYYQRLARQDLKWVFAGRANIAIAVGRTSGNLFVIDCESPETFREHCQQLAARNIPIFAAKTGRGGHIYLRAKEGEVSSIKLLDAEIRGQTRQYVVAPPSVHPSGAIYQWCNGAAEPPIVSIEEIDWLANEQGRVVLQAKRHYATSTNNYLRHGQNTPEGNRNNALYLAAHDMAWRGDEPQSIMMRLSKPAAASGLESKEISRTVTNGIRNGAAKAGASRHDILAHFAASYDGWSGRAGTTDRAVFEGLIERSRRDKNAMGEFRASIREIAELARVTAKTAQTSLNRLVSAGLIHRANEEAVHQKNAASVWKFTDKCFESRSYYTSAYGTERYHSVVIARSVLAENKALGKTAARVYAFLLNLGRPAQAAEIADCLHLSIHQVYRALGPQVLQKHEMVTKSPQGWQAIDAVPAELERAGRIADAKRRQHHISERQARAVVQIIRFREKHDSTFSLLSYPESKAVGD
jgi:predicted transcriptional regulator